MSPPTPVQWRLRVPNTEQIELRLGLAIKPKHPDAAGAGGLEAAPGYAQEHDHRKSVHYPKARNLYLGRKFAARS